MYIYIYMYTCIYIGALLSKKTSACTYIYIYIYVQVWKLKNDSIDVRTLGSSVIPIPGFTPPAHDTHDGYEYIQMCICILCTP